MLPEALVIFACVNSTGCQPTSSLYFSQNPEVKNQIDYDSKMARDYIGQNIVDTVGPILFVVGGGTGIVRLSEYFDLRVKKDSAIISFNLIF